MHNYKNNCCYGNQSCCMPCCNVGRPAPIMAPKKVCVSQSNCYVEQPVICPIECRHVQNVVYYPRYYPRYEQTFVTRDPSGNNMPGNGAGMQNMGMPTNGANMFGQNHGNSFKNGCGR